MNKETQKIAVDFEKRLVEVLRSALTEKIRSADVGKDLIKGFVGMFIHKFFDENNIRVTQPDIEVIYPDLSDLTIVRLDILNPETGEIMTLEKFMEYCGL